MIRDKGHYIMIKGSILEEDITIINIYATNMHQYIRQMLTNMKGEISSNTIIVGDFTTPLTDIPSKSSRIHFLLKCTWNILQNRSHLGSQIKPQ